MERTVVIRIKRTQKQGCRAERLKGRRNEYIQVRVTPHISDGDIKMESRILQSGLKKLLSNYRPLMFLQRM